MKHVEPWSGVHGTLKAYARRELSRLVGSDNPVGANNATEVLEDLFGSEYGGGQIPSRFRPEPSHFRPHPEDSKLVLQTLPRVAIDPITQGALKGRCSGIMVALQISSQKWKTQQPNNAVALVSFVGPV